MFFNTICGINDKDGWQPQCKKTQNIFVKLQNPAKLENEIKEIFYKYPGGNEMWIMAIKGANKEHSHRRQTIKIIY